MMKSEILEISKKYILAEGIMAEKFKDMNFSLFLRPALFSYSNDNLDYKLKYDDDGLHVNFYNSDGEFAAGTSSEYACGDYVYVREAYYKNDDGSIEYAADSIVRSSFERRRCVPARYAKKEDSRKFFMVKFVTIKKLYDITIEELHRLGYSSYYKFFSDYDMSLSEKQSDFGFALSENNPYVFIYDIEFVNVDDEGYIGNGSDGSSGFGSTLEKAMHMRAKEKKEKEKLIDDMSDDFPGLKRMYDMLKSD